jgi:hypothetical protein
VEGKRRPSDDDLLRRFFAAKDQGDMEQAAQIWETLCVGNRDRIEMWVRTWRHPDNGLGLPEEAQEAVQDALDGATRRMLGTLQGRSLGGFRGSLSASLASPPTTGGESGCAMTSASPLAR